MSDLDKTYFDATSVDINEQIDIWNERGKGYYGERQSMRAASH